MVAAGGPLVPMEECEPRDHLSTRRGVLGGLGGDEEGGDGVTPLFVACLCGHIELTW